MKFRVAAGIALAGILIAGFALGRGVLGSSAGGGWSHQAGEAWDAERMMVRTFEVGVPNLVLLVDPVLGELDDAEVAEAVAAMSDQLSSYTAITQLESYWSLGGPDSYASEDRSQGLVTARIGGSEAGLAGRAETVLRGIDYDETVIEVNVGGSALVQRDARREALGTVGPLAIAALLSIALVLLFLRKPVATAFIALTSAVAVALTFIALWGLGRLITLTTPAALLAVAVAWGAATAGGFVFGHRFVAECRAGASRIAAVVATVGSAGRTVAIAAGLSAVSLLSLWVMPTAILRSTAYAATLGVLAAGVSSILVLGIVLSLFGAGTTGGSWIDPVAAAGLTDRLARLAAAKPVITVVAGLVLLGGVSLVGLVGLNTGETTAESLPGSAQSRRVATVLADDFPVDEVDAPFVIGPNIEFGGAPAQLSAYTAELSTIDAVARADSTQGSFSDGEEVVTADGITDRLANERANLVRSPLSVPADSTDAQDALDQIDGVAAPFRADVGGTTARHLTTATAMDGRAPFLVAGALAALLLLGAWLLRGWRMALRLVVAAALSASGAVLVIRLGFVEGMLTSLLGSSAVTTLDAFAAPAGWTVGLALVGGWLALAWGAAREAFDVTEGSSTATRRSLSATHRAHLGAAVLLWLPFVALAAGGWRSLQMIATAVVGAGLIGVTVGRFVLTPALFALAPNRLWPRNVDGTVDAIYPRTAAAAWLVGAAEAPSVTSGPAVAGADAASDEEWIGADADLEAWERMGEPTPVPATPEAGPEPEGVPVEAPAPVAPVAGDEPTAEPAARRRRSRWRRTAATAGAVAAGADAQPVEPDAGSRPDDPEPAVVAAPEADTASDEVAAPEADTASDEVAAPEADTPSDEVDAPDLPSAEVDAPVDGVPAAEVDAPVDDEPAVELHEVRSPPAEEPAVVDAGAVGPPASGMVEVAEPVAEPEPAPSDVEVATVAEPDAGSEPDDVEPAVPDIEGPVASVDVVSLTESVIASIEADTPFTTEISSGYVANPSNNLSRVMEAILRDASRRGGEEVLVYGHAAAGRYRWMVVDSGPRADHDPERARTLAEAQRFIRRVGGVVECRPEGDFTVFVVEIPMAS